MSRSPLPTRILTAVPLCDGHDSAISTINLELIRHGVEVVYLGYHRSVRDIVRAAIQEDVRGVGISSYNGGHVEFFNQVVKGLRGTGIGVFGGGGGTITSRDAAIMRRRGVDRIFSPGESLEEIVGYVKQRFGGGVRERGAADADLVLARAISAAEIERQKTRGSGQTRMSAPPDRGATRVIGFTGPGGAGKTTLIDELVLRVLRRDGNSRIGILSHDPSLSHSGALLGDRATMIYSQDDRVFMRSLGSRGQAGGLAASTPACLEVLRRSGRFDWIFVETVGTGQEALPFTDGMVDARVLVMSPEYGSRLQLQKIAMLEEADVVVVNKSDLSAARTAVSEIARRLQGRNVVSTVAKKHGDGGVDRLLEMLGGVNARNSITVGAS